jgi:hypothetical protein
LLIAAIITIRFSNVKQGCYLPLTELVAATMTNAAAPILNVQPLARPADETNRSPHDPEVYRDILAKHDDHLIRDIGQTREDLLGLGKAFWSEWLKRKTPWQL